MALHLTHHAPAPDNAPTEVRAMVEADLHRVMEIERQVYSAPWSRAVFLQDLTCNALSRYVVAEQEGEILGYAGIWVFEQIGHITTVAVDPVYQRRGIGGVLLEAVMALGRAEGVVRFTLEVRVSNKGAQEMYKRHGYYAVGVRPRYYQDNKEDALIMWTDPETPDYDRGFTG
ncbi:MAG TPA: ribosomal protein S18-alanine N-acetyltransferase [bacterium]|nr:ribosomal protein S18-alanine N-acetyltransferase [bacterium]